MTKLPGLNILAPDEIRGTLSGSHDHTPGFARGYVISPIYRLYPYQVVIQDGFIRYITKLPG